MNKPFFDFAGSAPPTPEKLQGRQDANSTGSPARPAKAGAAPAAGAGRPAAHRPASARSAGRHPVAAAAPRNRGQEAGGGNQRRGSGHALMVGVFVLSALVGGGVAGLFLAMQDSVGTLPEDPAGSAAISIITPTTPGPGKKTPQPAAGERRAAAAAGAASASGGETVTPPARATVAASAAATADDTPRTAEASAAEDLKKLTEDVVSALGALGQAERQGTAEEAAAGTDRLRQSLADLVDAALARGKSDAEIRSLLTEALDNAGEVPAILRDASGKVDVRRLLASVMTTMRADAVPMSSDERDYFEQLTAEADTTSTANAPATRSANAGGKAAAAAARRPASRFFVRNGKRYTIIRRGDTLSDIAYAAYGDVLAYSAILRANRGRISVRNLKPGTRILIPDITTTRKTRRRKARRQGAVETSPAPADAVSAASAATASGASPAAAADDQAQPAGVKPVKITNFGPARHRRQQAATTATTE